MVVVVMVVVVETVVVVVVDSHLDAPSLSLHLPSVLHTTVPEDATEIKLYPKLQPKMRTAPFMYC